jgi:hypothetical protein
MHDWTKEPENTAREFLQFVDRKLPGISLVFCSTSEREFVEAVDLILDRTIRMLEGNAATHSGLGELALSTMLTDLIDNSGVPCQKERYHNGHVDVTIAHPRSLPYQYLGECKIYNGFKRHCDGCDQLLNRYSSGRDMRGFLLEFFTRPRMYWLLQGLRNNFDQTSPLKMKRTSHDHALIKGAFVSVHAHFTNTDVEVLHIGCNLYNPAHAKRKGKAR